MTVEVNALEGEVVVITGVVEGYSRNDADQLVYEAGGLPSSRVTSETTLLVVGDRPGATKQNAAKALGIETITEAEFRKRVGA